MSNPYPATPSFGGFYSGYPFIEAGVRDGQSISGQGGAPVSQHIGTHTTQPTVNSTTSLNNGNFQANAAISNSSHPFPPPIPPPPFHISPEIFKQFANSALPPPPYPPVPIPNLGYSQLPPPLPNFNATSTPPTDTRTNGALKAQQDQPVLNGHQPEPEYQRGPLVSAREEGELSDGELDEGFPDSMDVAGKPLRADQTSSSQRFLNESCSDQQGVSGIVGVFPSPSRLH